MKKILALILAAFMLCMAFVGCGKKEQAKDTGAGGDESSSVVSETSSKASAATSSNPVEQKPVEKPSTPAPTSSKTHTHSYASATCTSPRKCSCGATSGAALGHNFAAANCTTPKKCKRCGITEGTTAHNWEAATCSAPKTCTLCKKTEGKPLAHKISTKTSKCTVCGEFQLNIEYAARGAVKSSIDWFRSIETDWYSIRNVYYVMHDNDECACDRCDVNAAESGDLYITVVVVAEYSKNGVEDIIVDVTAVHELYDEALDTHYCLGYYTDAYTYSYNNNFEISSIHADDYSFYFNKDDLIWIDTKKVV